MDERLTDEEQRIWGDGLAAGLLFGFGLGFFAGLAVFALAWWIAQ